jgi:hypothetical protein
LAQKPLARNHGLRQRYLSMRPTPIRGDRKIALNLAEALALQGYLAPIPTHRYDRKAWQIVGKTGENARLSQ